MSPPAKKRMTTAKKKKPTPQSPTLMTPTLMLSTAKKRKTTATTKIKPTPALMSSPAKKRKTTATTNKTPQSSPILSLPYDLLLNCLARVSRLYYPTLSLVSKSFRSLLVSPELYKARSLLGRTESCLYVCLQTVPTSCWFTLCMKPDGMLTNDTSTKKSSGYVLATVPNPQDPEKRDPVSPGVVVVGSNIYSIGPRRPCLDFSPSPVWILDCRSHTWHKAPCLRVKLTSFSASVLDQKIYVAGCCKDGDSNSFKNLIEVFDTKTQTWDPKPIPCSETNDYFYHRTACIDGKFHVVHLINNKVVAYNSKEGKWDLVGEQMGRYMGSDSYCEIHNVLYSAHDGEISWYDTEISEWRKLKGLVGLPNFPPVNKTGIRLADYGGKMAVLWDKTLPCDYHSLRKMIWCAEITLEKRKSSEIWGKVEWVDHVLTIPSFGVVKVLAATV